MTASTEYDFRQLCQVCRVHVSLCDWEGQHPDDPIIEATDQIIDAERALAVPGESYMRWPWPALDGLYGGMAPGTVHYVVGYSGLGKTTFISSAIRLWREQGKTLDVLPLELKAHTFRTYLACQSLGVDPGYMLSGDFTSDLDAKGLRTRVAAAVRAQIHENAIRVRGVSAINVAEFRKAVELAKDRGADAVIVDHIDHIESGAAREQGIELATAVNRAALRFAQDFNICLILMSQANAENIRAAGKDHLAKYAPLRDNHVWMGQIKRQVCTGMLCLFRPTRQKRQHETDKEFLETMRRARDGEEPPQDVLMPQTGGVMLMKSRNYGSREGKRILLTLKNGLFVEHDPLPRSMT